MLGFDLLRSIGLFYTRIIIKLGFSHGFRDIIVWPTPFWFPHNFVLYNLIYLHPLTSQKDRQKDVERPQFAIIDFDWKLDL